jgi:Nup85 Nucleoporin
VDPDLSTLSLLMSGDDATLQARAESWSQLLCAVLLYQQPAADGAKLYQFMRTCKAAKGENVGVYSEAQRALLQAAEYAMQGDVGSLIQVQLIVPAFNSRGDAYVLESRVCTAYSKLCRLCASTMLSGTCYKRCYYHS